MLPPMARYRLFLSAVSSEFERARDLLAASLRAREMDIAVQSDFRQHDDTTLHKLHDYTPTPGEAEKPPCQASRLGFYRRHDPRRLPGQRIAQ
jgi:hypothetical protein